MCQTYLLKVTNADMHGARACAEQRGRRVSVEKRREESSSAASSNQDHYYYQVLQLVWAFSLSPPIVHDVIFRNIFKISITLFHQCLKLCFDYSAQFTCFDAHMFACSRLQISSLNQSLTHLFMLSDPFFH